MEISYFVRCPARVSKLGRRASDQLLGLAAHKAGVSETCTYLLGPECLYLELKTSDRPQSRKTNGRARNNVPNSSAENEVLRGGCRQRKIDEDALQRLDL